MKITKPLEDYDLYVVYDVFDPELIRKFADLYTARAWYSGYMGKGIEVVNEIERSALQNPMTPAEDLDFNTIEMGIPETLFGIENEASHFNQIVETLQNIMIDLYPDVNVAKHEVFQGISIRTPEGGLLDGLMMPHIDGPPEDLGPNHGIKNIGGLFYLNDDFDGGELYYPDIGFEFKPVPNSFVTHRGEIPYRHGVKEIYNGWRLNLGLFALEDYDPNDYEFYRARAEGATPGTLP